MSASDSSITHRCSGDECMCVYDPECNPAMKAIHAAHEARVNHVAGLLEEELAAWISSHPNAGLFDYRVLARHVLDNTKGA